LDAASRGQIALWGRGLGQPQSMFPDFRHSPVANDSSPVLAFASFAWQSSSPASFAHAGGQLMTPIGQRVGLACGMRVSWRTVAWP
jgi:hypothetical protein